MVLLRTVHQKVLSKMVLLWGLSFFMYSSSSQVFVQCWSVSCYCGHQGTVVYCSICHLSFGDLQVQMFFVRLCFSNITVLLLWTHTFQSLQEKFRCSVGILSVPLKTLYVSSTVVAWKSHFSSFKSMIFSREGCYCIRGNALWENVKREDQY